MTLKHLSKKIHLWLSIPLGLILTIICITGAILTFQNEILEISYPERYFVKETKAEPLSIDKLVTIVNSQLDKNTVSSIKIPTEKDRTYTATLTEGFRISVFVDPYTGDIKGTYKFQDSFFYSVMALHRWLLDSSRTWGKYIVGITTLLFVFILISGFIWWIPKDRTKLKSRFQIKTKAGIKRILYDLHVSLGIYVCIFLLICSLTGLMWSFDWYRNSVNKLFGVEANNKEKKVRGHGKGDKTDSTPIIYDNWQKVYNDLLKKVPDSSYITIADGTATVLSKTAPHSRATDKYSFEPKSGKITKASLFAEDKSGSKVISWAYALHVGAYGGIFTRVLTCIACIIGATMPLTGYYLFLKKRKKHKKTRN